MWQRYLSEDHGIRAYSRSELVYILPGPTGINIAVEPHETEPGCRSFARKGSTNVKGSSPIQDLSDYLLSILIRTFALKITHCSM